MHGAIQKILQRDRQQDGEASPATVVLSSHIVINSQLSTVSQDATDVLVKIVSKGLIGAVGPQNRINGNQPHVQQASTELVAAACLKLLAVGSPKVRWRLESGKSVVCDSLSVKGKGVRTQFVAVFPSVVRCRQRLCWHHLVGSTGTSDIASIRQGRKQVCRLAKRCRWNHVGAS